jgi:hypothetical protein
MAYGRRYAKGYVGKDPHAVSKTKHFRSDKAKVQYLQGQLRKSGRNPEDYYYVFSGGDPVALPKHTSRVENKKRRKTRKKAKKR